MKIKVNEKNREKIEKLIAKENGKKRERIIGFSDLLRAIEKAENWLSKYPKKYHVDCKVYNVWNLPYSYRQYADYIQYVLIKGQSGWFVINIRRSQASKTTYGGGQNLELVKSEALKNYIIENEVNKVVKL